MKFEDVVDERLPVWTALSEMFLDTELQEADLQRIADTLRCSPYSVAEIKRILRDEVSPAFSANLFSMAGEWVPWSHDEVRAIMERSMRSWSPVAAVRAQLRSPLSTSDWNRILTLMG